jgi:hypothetical protein
MSVVEVLHFGEGEGEGEWLQTGEWLEKEVKCVLTMC